MTDDQPKDESIKGNPANPPKKPLLEPKEEFQILLEGIKENSKHARTVMFFLIGACLYVLLAAFSQSVAGSEHLINLPIINVEVTEKEFFFFSPLIILLAYIYLHIYIRELRERLSGINDLIKDHPFAIKNPNHLLFPWLIVFAFQTQENQKILREEIQPKRGSPLEARRLLQKGILVRAISTIIIWLLGPVVLLILWGQFVGNREAVSIIPCFCLVFSVCMARWTAQEKLPLWIKTSLVLVALGFIFFTLSSVPDLSTPLGLNAFYSFINSLLVPIMSITISWWLWIIILIVTIQLLPLIIFVLLRPFGKLTRKLRLKIALVDNFWEDYSDNVLIPIYLSHFFSWLILDIITKSPLHRTFFGIPKRISNDIFYGCDLENSYLNFCIFENADLSDALFRGAKLKNTKFINCTYNNTNFYSADLSYSTFENENLAGTMFAGANISGANFKNSNLSDTDLQSSAYYFGKMIYSKSTIFPDGFVIPDTFVLVDEAEEKK